MPWRADLTVAVEEEEEHEEGTCEPDVEPEECTPVAASPTSEEVERELHAAERSQLSIETLWRHRLGPEKHTIPSSEPSPAPDAVDAAFGAAAASARNPPALCPPSQRSADHDTDLDARDANAAFPIRAETAPQPSEVEQHLASRLRRSFASAKSTASHPPNIAEVERAVDSSLERCNSPQDVRSEAGTLLSRLGIHTPNASLDTQTSSLLVHVLLSRIGGFALIDESDDQLTADVSTDGIDGALRPLALALALNLSFSLPATHSWSAHLSPRIRVARGARQVVLSSTANRALIAAADVDSCIVDAFCTSCLRQSHMFVSALEDCIVSMLAHSSSKALLSRLLSNAAERGCQDAALRCVKSALKQPEALGPTKSFQLNGINSGLLARAHNRWPFNAGLTFVAWVYMETFAQAEPNSKAGQFISPAISCGSDTADNTKAFPASAAAPAGAAAGESEASMPRLFSFLAGEGGLGIEAMFRGHYLVLEVTGQRTKRESTTFTHPIPSRQWNCIALELATNSARLYVEGELKEAHHFGLPSIARPLNFTCIGSNPPPTLIPDSQRKRKQSPLVGELGPCLVFDCAIGGRAVFGLSNTSHFDLASKLLGMWCGQVRSGSGTLPEQESTLSRALESHALHVFHPSSCNSGDRSVSDLTSNGGKGRASAFATPLNELVITTRDDLYATLWSLGQFGPVCLLTCSPGLLDGTSLHPITPSTFDSRRSHAHAIARALEGISIMCKHHAPTLNWLVQTSFIEILSHLLLSRHWKGSGKNRSKSQRMPQDVESSAEAEVDLVRAVFELEDALASAQTLHWQLWNSVILEPRIWKAMSTSASLELCDGMKTAAAHASRQTLLRSQGALQRTLDMAKACTQNLDDDNSDFAQAIMIFVNIIAKSDDQRDMQAILRLVADIVDCDLAAELLRVLRSMLQQPNARRKAAATQAFLSAEGPSVALVVLRRFTSKSARISQNSQQSGKATSAAVDEAMKLAAVLVAKDFFEEGDRRIAFFMMQSAMQVHAYTLEDLGTHTAVLQTSLSSLPHTFDASVVDGASNVESICLLGVFLTSLPEAPPEIQMRGLQDLLLLACTDSGNRSALQQAAGWPEALTRVLMIAREQSLSGEHNVEQVASVVSMSKNLFTVVLQHAMRSADGWRTWERILQVILDAGAREQKALLSIATALDLFCDLLRFSSEELRSAAQSSSFIVTDPERSSPADVAAESKMMRDNTLCLLVEFEGFLRTIGHLASEEFDCYDSLSSSTSALAAPEVAVHTWLLASLPCHMTPLLAGKTNSSISSTLQAAASVLVRESLRAGCEIVKVLITCIAIEGVESIASDEHLLLIRILITTLREDQHEERYLPHIPNIVSDFSDPLMSSQTNRDAAAQSSGTEALLRKAIEPLISRECNLRLVDRALALVWLMHHELVSSSSYGDDALQTKLAQILSVVLSSWSTHLWPVFQLSEDEGNMLDNEGLTDGNGGILSAEHFKDSRWARCLAKEHVNEHIEMTLSCVGFVQRNSENSARRRASILEGEGKFLAESVGYKAWWSSDSEWYESRHGRVESKLTEEEEERRQDATTSAEKWSRECARCWRSFMKRLIEQDTVFPGFAGSLNILWRVDDTESATRERRRLIPDFELSSHESAAIDDYGPERDQCDAHDDLKSADDEMPTVKQPIGEAIRLGGDEEDEEDEIEAQIANLEDEFEASAKFHTRSREAQQSQRGGSEDLRTVFEAECELVRPLDKVSGIFKVSEKETSFTPYEEGKAPQATALGHDSIDQVHCRRYLLRKTALEIYLTTRRSLLFNFSTKKERKRAVKAVTDARPPHLGNDIYLDGRKRGKLGKVTSLVESWTKREISNFDYLMHLNTLAGRSFNDLTQYPVFPWIVQDYTSSELDLKQPSSYRDLSKPVGALNPERLQKFIDRFNAFEDPVVPKFMYGSHYSSGGIVLHYLLRLEPFTSYAIELQGGSFDHPDRLFGSVPETWRSVLSDMSDVKELVPEWYYCPEMFENVNDVNLGRRQNGSYVGGVELPPWAKGPHDFVSKLRAALESDYVSENLHHWIDLIFGFKQQGQAAREANNVFYYLTYEGYVNVDAITDPLMLKATQDQIAFFGQTPTQLFKQAHPKRQLREDMIVPVHVSQPSNIQAYLLHVGQSNTYPACSPRMLPDGVLVVSQSLDLLVHKIAFNRSDGKTRPFTYYGIRRPTNQQQSIADAISRKMLPSSTRLPTARTTAASLINSIAIEPNGHAAFVAGNSDGLLYGFSLNSLKCYEKATSLSLDSPAVCVSACQSGRLLSAATASGAVMLLSLPLPGDVLHQSQQTTMQYGMQLHSHSRYSSSGSNTTSSLGSSGLQQGSVEGSAASTRPLPAGAVPLNHFVDAVEESQRPITDGRAILDAPIHVLHGRSEAAESTAMSAELDVVVSVSRREGTVLHSVLSGRMVRRIPGARGDDVRLCSSGYIMVLDSITNTLMCASMNGDIVASLSPEDSVIADIAPTADGRGVLVAHRNMRKGDSALRVHQLPLLEQVHRLELPGWAEISSLALTTDNTNVLACTPEGKLYVLTDPSTSLKLLSKLLRQGFTV